MLQSICGWRLRMAKALQDTNHHIQGFNFFLKKTCNQYTCNIYIYPFYIFLITLAQ